MILMFVKYLKILIQSNIFVQEKKFKRSMENPRNVLNDTLVSIFLI